MTLEHNHRRQIEVGHWEFGKYNWPKRLGIYELLPPPHDLNRTQEKVWKYRGYGLWPGKILREKQTRLEINQPENDLFAGKIAFDLIDHDRDNFEKLSEQNHFKVAFFNLSEAIEKSLEQKEKRLEDYLVDVVGSQIAPELFTLIYNVIEDCSETFISACRRKSVEPITNDLIVRQLEIMMVKLDSINQNMLATRDIMRLKSPVASGSH